MRSLLRNAVLAISLAIPVKGLAENKKIFTAPDGSYTFQYPKDFTLSHMFADGSGDVTGITASSMKNGDVYINFFGPRDAGNIVEVSEQNKQTIISEFTKSIAVLPSIKFRSSAMTTMLDKPALDMVFTNKRFKTLAINRYIFTVGDGKIYNFECIYPEDKAEQFATACNLAVSTVKLHTANASSVRN